MLRRVYLGFPADTHHAWVPSWIQNFTPNFYINVKKSLSLGADPINWVNKWKEVLESWEKTRVGWHPLPTKGIEKGEIVKELCCNVTIRRPVIGKSTFPHLLCHWNFDKVVWGRYWKPLDWLPLLLPLEFLSGKKWNGNWQILKGKRLTYFKYKQH